MKLNIKSIIVGILLFSPLLLSADEGMWLVHLINKGLAQKMEARGLKLDSKTLYDEENLSLSDAIVSLGFSCSGSIISNDGLVITNHHCAYSDVHSISTPEHNYLEEGFWAMTREEERPIKRDGFYILKKVLDVTEEVQTLRDSTGSAGNFFGMRKVYATVEKKYEKIFEGQGEVSCTSMWGGQKYYLALYEVYKDVRLVAAPPVCIASFGGDIDNWEWPQHKGDFAMYRIYTAPDGSPAEYSPNNVPLKPKKVLKVSTDGVKTGDFTMIMGYPGSTNRYASSFEVSAIENISNPIQARLQRGQMDIMEKWMNKDPKVRLKYSDHFLSLSNLQEIREGEIMCYKRFKVVEAKREQERKMQEWIMADPSRAQKWGDLFEKMEQKYNAVSGIDEQINYFRESIVRSSRMHLLINFTERFAERMANRDSSKNIVLAADSSFMKLVEEELGEVDLSLERDMYEFALGEFYSHIDSTLWGGYLRELYNSYNGDVHSINEHIWNNSMFSSEENYIAFLNEGHPFTEYLNDPHTHIKYSADMYAFNKKKDEYEKGVSTYDLERQYLEILYLMNEDYKIPQYPDANSTMRITYGTVGPLYPNDGVIRFDRSTAVGILEKYNPNDYNFTLNSKVLKLYRDADWGRWADKESGKMVVNFLTDNDITGGNSGSAVLNGSGEVVGLAFDGNKESLASDTHYVPNMNKCVCVDIRYVLWVLEKYAGMEHIVKEIFSE